jgi:hypothetical protein
VRNGERRLGNVPEFPPVLRYPHFSASEECYEP